MKTILWATLTANGNYARGSARHVPRPESLADFAATAKSAKNFVVGRKTFEDFRVNATRRPTGESALEGVEIVVVSRSLELPPGAPATVVRDPRAALAHVRARGHQTALVAGGEALHNAFLAEGLIDELAIVLTPALEDDGRKILLPPGERREATLLDSKDLGGGLLRLHYALGPKDVW